MNKQKNRICGVTIHTDRKLKLHDTKLKGFCVAFNEVAKSNSIPVRMRMDKRDTLDGDGKFERMDGAGTTKFEWTFGTTYPHYGNHPLGAVILRTQKFRKYHTFNIVIQGAYDGSGVVVFKMSDVPKDKQLISMTLKKVFNGEVNQQDYVKIPVYREYKTADLLEFVKYI